MSFEINSLGESNRVVFETSLEDGVHTYFELVSRLQAFYKDNIFYGANMEQPPNMNLEIPGQNSHITIVKVIANARRGKEEAYNLPPHRVVDYVHGSNARPLSCGVVGIEVSAKSPLTCSRKIVDHAVDYPTAGNHGYVTVVQSRVDSLDYMLTFNTFPPSCMRGELFTGEAEKRMHRIAECNRFIDFLQHPESYRK